MGGDSATLSRRESAREAILADFRTKLVTASGPGRENSMLHLRRISEHPEVNSKFPPLRESKATTDGQEKVVVRQWVCLISTSHELIRVLGHFVQAEVVER